MEKRFNWNTALDSVVAKTTLNEKQKDTAKRILKKLKESKDGIRELEKSVSAPDLVNALINAIDDINDAMVSVISIGAKRTLNLHYCKGKILNLSSEDQNISDEIENLIKNS